MLAWQFRVAYMPQSEFAAIYSNLRITVSVASQFPPATCRFPLAIRLSATAIPFPSFAARLPIAFKWKQRKLFPNYTLNRLVQSKGSEKKTSAKS